MFTSSDRHWGGALGIYLALHRSMMSNASSVIVELYARGRVIPLAHAQLYIETFAGQLHGQCRGVTLDTPLAICCASRCSRTW